MVGLAAPRYERAQAALLAAVLTAAVAGWWITAERMAGMDEMGSLDLGGLGFYATVWVVMMAAMMFPSVWPLVLVYDRVARARGRAAWTLLLVAGYLATWTVLGLAAYALVVAGRELTGGALAWDEAGRPLAAGTLIAAAVYQFTPYKDACLRRCRGPLMFVMERWRATPGRALRMGAEHGAWCVGCCWALMAALFALGVMNVGWMAFVAALIAGEKLLPWPRVANAAAAVLLLGIGAALLVEPSLVPGIGTDDAAAPVPAAPMEMGMP